MTTLRQQRVADTAQRKKGRAVEVSAGKRVGNSVAEHGADHAGIRDVPATVVTIFRSRKGS